MIAKTGWEFQSEVEMLEEQLDIAQMYRSVCDAGSPQWHSWNDKAENLERRLDLERERELVMIDRRTSPAYGPERDYCNQRLEFIDVALGAIHVD